MRHLHTVQDAALLVHEGIIRDVGPARRVENLVEARGAREVDCGNRIVLPAFVDPDTVLVTAGSEIYRRNTDPTIATSSKKRLEGITRHAVEDWARHGVLALGAASRGAVDLRSARKLLTLQQSFQHKPIRLRSVFVPPIPEDWDHPRTLETIHDWARSIAQRRLAGVLELDVPPPGADPARAELLRRIAREAVHQGFVTRIRSEVALDGEMQRLVSDTAALSATTPGLCRESTPDTLRACCVLILTAAAVTSGHACSGRQLIDDGWAVALSAGYRTGCSGSFNPQYVIHLACRELGMTLAEAITACTWNAATALRMAPVAGSLEAGKQADLVVLDLPDYRELSARPGQNDVETVFRAGRLVYRRNGILGDLAPAREDTRLTAARS